MDNNIGKKLDGRYELLELIGVGGMADIYRARDVQEDRIVAVKILKTEFAGSEEFLRRFRNESKAIALLSHPNIVKIYDVGFTDKVQFIVMEYVDGITLTDYIEQQGVLKWRDAVHFTVQVLRALQHAHDRGIVHRDVKSSNVMLLRDGTIKVMDFGIARFNRENNKTMSEKTIGSVHYISPEQARGDITDERSDIYSVGVALYEMLTGRKPFDGDTPVAIALKHMQSNPKRPTEINETIPEGLEQIVLRAMQKEPQARYQTAGEMISDLEDFKKNPGIVFDYKYSSTDGTAKFADRSNPAAEMETSRRKSRIRIDDDYDDDDDDDEYDDDDDEYEERRSPMIPILFAVGAAFVIATVFLVLTLVSNRLGAIQDITSNSGTSDTDISIFPDNEFAVPSFIGEDWDTVYAKYENNEYFKIKAEQQYSEFTQNQIFDQDPPEGRRAKIGTTITVKVSMGARKVEIQDFTNRTQSAAEQQLKREGFKVTSQFSESDDIPKGNVIKTLPAAHEMAQVGSTVYLIVSLGPTNTPVYVENYVGLPQEEADRLCKEQGLIPIFEPKDSEAPAGEIIAQDKPRSTIANKGDELKLTVSTGVIPEISKTVNIDLPNNITGEFKIKYYVDAVLDQAASNEIRDVSLSGSKRIRYDVKGKPGETKYLAIKVESQATGKEGTFIEVEITFSETEGTAKQIGQPNSGIFAELLKGDTNTPSSSSSESSSSSTSSTPGYSEPTESTDSSDSSDSSNSSDDSSSN